MLFLSPPLSIDRLPSAQRRCSCGSACLLRCKLKTGDEGWRKVDTPERLCLAGPLVVVLLGLASLSVHCCAPLIAARTLLCALPWGTAATALLRTALMTTSIPREVSGVRHYFEVLGPGSSIQVELLKRGHACNVLAAIAPLSASIASVLWPRTSRHAR